jgi:lysophospholipase L1-like esterase
MFASTLRRLLAASLLAVAACSSASTGGAPTDGTPDTGAPSTSSLAFQTYVVLGDSISDGGGQGPFFYDLLNHNDDATWPDAHGKDLQTRYPGIQVVKASKAGATANGLASQAQGLSTSLAGPVLVTITIGGNDVTAAMGKLLIGSSDAQDRATFASELDAALQELTKPDRFGAGVEATVLLANIYDPSDGTGNFTYQGSKCQGALGLWPATRPTTPLLTPWEQVMTDTATKYPRVTVLGLHERFDGHGVAAHPTWFFSDCIHPNSAGHDQVRGLFWDAIEKI